jgi:hypothetical protein
VKEKPRRDLILALFHRIGEQSDLKEVWDKIPNAERNALAGDFYNIIISHSSMVSKEREEQPHQHCDHECVCWWYYEHRSSGTAAPCKSNKCHHRIVIDFVDADTVLDELEKFLNGVTGLDGAPYQYKKGALCSIENVKRKIKELRNKKQGKE